MQAAGWADKLAAKGLAAASCHPGVATSAVSLGLGFDLDRSEQAQRDGAATPVFLAMAEQLQNGGYYADKRLSPCEFCKDVSSVEKLFRICEGAN